MDKNNGVQQWLINHTFLPQAQHKKVRFIAKPLAFI